MPTIGVFAQGSATKLYLPVKTTINTSLTLGYAVGLALNGVSFDGAQAMLLDSDVADHLPGFIGVANGDIAASAYGLVQCWGFAASVYLSQYGTSVTVNQGNPLVPGKEAGGLGSTVPTYLNAGFKYIVCSNPPATVSMAKTANYASGLVRCF